MTAPLDYIIVDDDLNSNIITRLLVKKYLNPASINVFTSAGEGLEHLKTLFSQQQDTHRVVLFLDINMPVMSGWDFLDQFARFDPSWQARVKIIMLSSSLDQKDLDRAAENKLVAVYLAKPLYKETLINILG